MALSGPDVTLLWVTLGGRSSGCFLGWAVRDAQRWRGRGQVRRPLGPARCGQKPGLPATVGAEGPPRPDPVGSVGPENGRGGSLGFPRVAPGAAAQGQLRQGPQRPGESHQQGGGAAPQKQGSSPGRAGDSQTWKPPPGHKASNRWPVLAKKTTTQDA